MSLNLNVVKSIVKSKGVIAHLCPICRGRRADELPSFYYLHGDPYVKITKDTTH